MLPLHVFQLSLLAPAVTGLAIVWRIEDIQGNRNPTSPRQMGRSRRSYNSESELVPTHKYSVGNWTVKWDFTYQAWYYHDKETGLSTWDKPDQLKGFVFAEPEHSGSRSDEKEKTFNPYDFKSKIVEAKKYWGPWNILYDIWAAVLDRALAADVFQFRWQWT